FTQGGGLGGLALVYYQAAPPGLRRSEPGHFSGRWARPARNCGSLAHRRWASVFGKVAPACPKLLRRLS
ncbi:MAG: hypothetical protein ACREIC_28430, partial [Limisphaerales bacterium]